MRKNNKVLYPTIFLGLSGPNGKATDSPLFAAVHLTYRFLARLELLSKLCRKHHLSGVETRVIDPPVYFDTPDGSQLAHAIELSTVWSATGCHHFVELHGRMPLAEGGHGRLEFIASSSGTDVATFREWWDEKNPVAFYEAGDHDWVFDESFELMVHRRLAEMTLWPRPGATHELCSKGKKGGPR